MNEKRVILVNPANYNHLQSGDEIRVYHSSDGTKSPILYPDGLPRIGEPVKVVVDRAEQIW